jgi:outer membrane lipoprotein SlyB
MTLRPTLHALLLAACLTSAGIALPPTAAAQNQRAQAEADWRTPRITGFDVEPVRQIVPGTELAFSVWGSPGLAGRLSIDGAARSTPLEEVASGHYRAWYTVGSADNITPASRATANLRDGTRVATAVLDEALVAGSAPAQPAAAGAAPVIERFEARVGPEQRTGQELAFMLRGTPGGQASVRLRGPQRRVMLQEGSVPGEYSGSVTLRATDKLDPGEPVMARLRVGERSVTAPLTPPLAATSVAKARVAAVCVDCATVVSIRPVEVRGDGSYVGPLAGGVLGAVVGNQVGDGSGRSAATVAGAIGGALLGREIERRRNKRTTHYDIVVRMDDGSERTISVPDTGGLRVGDPVNVGPKNQIALDTSRPRPKG